VSIVELVMSGFDDEQEDGARTPVTAREAALAHGFSSPLAAGLDDDEQS